MKIANTLTDDGIPTPRMSSERQRKEAEGKEYKRKVNSAWSIVTVQGILENDFYIGTMRSSKYTRKKINGKDVKLDESEHIVIENHHQAIIGYREFATVRALMESRSKGNQLPRSEKIRQRLLGLPRMRRLRQSDVRHEPC